MRTLMVLLFIFLGLNAEGGETSLTLDAHADFYYMYNFNEPFPVNSLNGTTVSSATLPIGNSPLRLYDSYHNQISMNLVELTVRGQKKSTSFLIDFDFGQAADINARIGAGTTRVEDEVSKNIGAAYLVWTPPSSEYLKVTVGKFPTHLGLETWKPRDNWNYSRSIGFSFAQPWWHTGIKVNYAFDQISMLFGLYNGWNTIYDANSSKTVGAQLKYAFSEELSATYNFVGGAEQDNESVSQRLVHEFNMMWNSSSHLKVGASLLAGSEQNVDVAGVPHDLVRWSTWSLLANWKFSDTHTFSPRIEWFSDDHGSVLGKGEQKIWSMTLTDSFDLGDGLTPRLEARYDKTSVDSVFSRRGAAVPDQFTFLIAILYNAL